MQKQNKTVFLPNFKVLQLLKKLPSGFQWYFLYKDFKNNLFFSIKTFVMLHFLRKKKSLCSFSSIHHSNSYRHNTVITQTHPDRTYKQEWGWSHANESLPFQPQIWVTKRQEGNVSFKRTQDGNSGFGLLILK